MRRIVDIDFYKKEITNYLCGLHTNMLNCKQIENFSWEKIKFDKYYIYIYIVRHSENRNILLYLKLALLIN